MAASPTEITTNATLVKYDNPVLLSKMEEERLKAKKVSRIDGSQQQAEEILNAILPPNQFSNQNQQWIQRVSSTPATRDDVQKLQEELDKRLQLRKARETGICPVRRELYDQLFDELIRQVTINTAGRGLLLLRVRDEIRMTVQAYQTLYESSVAFGMRKALQAEQGKAEMEQKIIALEREKKGLEDHLNVLEGQLAANEKQFSEKKALDEKKHQETVAFLKRTNAQLKSQLETILAPVKSK